MEQELKTITNALCDYPTGRNQLNPDSLENARTIISTQLKGAGCAVSNQDWLVDGIIRRNIIGRLGAGRWATIPGSRPL